MSALDKFSREAARRYLGSAIFVDDHIFDQGTNRGALPMIDVPQRKRILRDAPERQTIASDSRKGDATETGEQPYHPKDLVSSFAREGITCTLYEPPTKFDTDGCSEIFRLCERLDLIILDWDFSGDRGSKALDLIVALLRQSSEEFPHSTRLITVYTAEQSLAGVANKILSGLEKNAFTVTPESSQLRLRVGATRLVVLGKPIKRFPVEEVDFTVKESGLATRVIDEFVAMNTGILAAYALYGLAAIRQSSKRILDRFHGDLDGAFLLHRALVSNSEEAFDQLPELLSAEICAVVEENRLEVTKAQEIANAAISSMHISQSDQALIKESLLPQSKAKRIATKLIESTNTPSPGHLRLAALFSSRTHYASTSRKLGFGTVVRYRTRKPANNTVWHYAICLIPSCDSLRIDCNRIQFPFWSIETETFTIGQKRNGMVVPLGNDQFVPLSASGKAGDKLWTDSFTVDAATKTVLASPSRPGNFPRYKGTKRIIEWIGELKPLHAHRIVREITDTLSRIGVSEAEWLRLLCSKG